MKLASERMPELLSMLEQALETPFLAKELFRKGSGIKTALALLSKGSGLSHNQDFQGLYALKWDGRVNYVGISKHVIERLIQHFKGNDHYSASLAYRLAKQRTNHNGRREELNEELKKDQEVLLGKAEIAFLQIEDAKELYLFELYAAMFFECEHNLFETH